MNRVCIFGLSLCLSACHQASVYSTQKTRTSQQLQRSDIQQQTIYKTQKAVSPSYLIWRNAPLHQQQIYKYKHFLKSQGLNLYIPDAEFFQTARDWQKCNYPEYEVPPQELWNNIIPTLNILHQLVDRKIVTDFSVTSVYRSYALNQCAGGAGSSKHVFNAALDFRIGAENPDIAEQQSIQETKAKLCQFWLDHGEALSMGLGVYESGQIHIDSAGYRTWGVDHRYTSSPCMEDSLNHQHQSPA